MIDRILAWWTDLLDPYPYVRRAVVHTKTGRSIEGVLWCRRRGFLVMREASVLDGKLVTPLDGETLIPRDQLDFLQVLAPIGGQKA